MISLGNGRKCLAPLAARRENKTREKGSRKGAEIAKECTIHAWICMKVSRAVVVSVQGRASCPSTNNVRPIFKAVVSFLIGGVVSKRLDIFQRLGHFLWEGMKPFPALGKSDPCMDRCVIIRDRRF